MNIQRLLALVILTVVVAAATKSQAYQPTAENLKAREAFQRDRFGVFIHWGVYSVLGRGEWVMNNEKMSVEKYEPLARRFNPVKFNADEWVKLFKSSGARYITITSKHHDGFCMWDSKLTDWDIVDRTPYGKDILKQLAEACARHDMKLFFYHSRLDWRHPDYYPRGRTGLHSVRPDSGDFDKYLDYMDGQLAELVGGQYGEVAGIWFDGWWDQQSKKLGKPKAPVKKTQIDWRSEKTYSVIHGLRPACLIGANHHVAPFPGEDFQMFERDLPGENTTGFSPDAKIGKLPLESCDTINGSWGYNAGDKRFKSVKQLIHYLVKAAGRDANLLLNVGPLPDGTIDPESAKRLTGVGQWLAQNGKTIYGTRSGPIPPQSWGVSTKTGKTVYLHILNPQSRTTDGWLTLTGVPGAKMTISTLSGDSLSTSVSKDGTIRVKLANWDPVDTILVLPVAK